MAATLARRRALAVALALAVAGGAYAALRTAQRSHSAVDRPAWTEVAWPFAVDHWGRGRAFRCPAAACGSEINLYLRSKFGFCGCASTIEDGEVDRIADFDLVGGEHTAVGAGRPIVVLGMAGRLRRYALASRGADARPALAIALHDRCDMVVATAVAAGADHWRHENAVVEFLNTDAVRRWAEVTLGL
jgi:hypothetical protein